MTEEVKEGSEGGREKVKEGREGEREIEGEKMKKDRN